MKRLSLRRAIAVVAIMVLAVFAAIERGGIVSGAEAQTGPFPGAPPGRLFPGRVIPPPGGAPAQATPPTTLANGEVILNYPSADVHDVAKSILGDTLGLNYSVDPSASGNVTVETANPVKRADVLPVFEQSLKAAKLGLIKHGDVYTIIPLDQARKQAQLLANGQPGYGAEMIQLHYVNAVDLKKLLDPLVPDQAIAQADAGRNVLLITGTESERQSIRELVEQFDVNWLKGMAFQLFTPKRTQANQIVPELDQLLNTKDAPTAGLVRLLSIDRLNGILAISKQPQYLDVVRSWIDALDREGEGSERKLFVYRVQNGRASDLATVLVNALGGSAGKNGSSTSNTSGGGAEPAAAFQFDQNNNNNTNGSGSYGGGTNPSQPQTGMQGGANQSQTQNQLLPNGSGNTAQPVTQQLQLAGSISPITVTSDEVNNAIVSYATPHDYTVIEDALKRLDVPPLQVLIEATITEVTLNDTLRYGVQWFFNRYSDSQVALSQGSVPIPTQILPGFSYLLSSGNTVTATLDALSSITQINVVSAPKLLVLNNHTAALQVGDEVPIVSATAVSTETTSAPIVNDVQYKDTGVILKVTPRVNDGGLVLLDISQEVSDVAPTSSSNIDSPTIQQRKIASSIAIQNGQTIALGGLIRDNRNVTKAGIPWVNQIPLLGNLFGSTNNTGQRTELLVLLTPRVIRNTVDSKAITDELREKIRAMAPPPPPIKPLPVNEAIH